MGKASTMEDSYESMDGKIKKLAGLLWLRKFAGQPHFHNPLPFSPTPFYYLLEEMCKIRLFSRMVGSMVAQLILNLSRMEEPPVKIKKTFLI